jgi:RNA-directed DNA polymerase
MSRSFEIPKRMVFQAYQRVKRNKGAAGVDGITIDRFDQDLKRNLYKIWNRMLSGSYHPQPVKQVAIPKANGDERLLGIPTVADRIAQTTVQLLLEPRVDPLFHQDSYGYRPRKSAHAALEVARRRCWRSDWCIDLDIKGFFDNVVWELVMKAVEKHAEEKWVILYVKRWLECPVLTKEGNLLYRCKGTAQGASISPLLTNMFMHYAFDSWMSREFSTVPFERYSDDIIVHCKTRKQAEYVLARIKHRLGMCQLQLHPEKTKIVYCRDEDRGDDYSGPTSFDFLGFTFRPRLCRNKSGKMFVNFTPGISNKAKANIREAIRSWDIHRRSGTSVQEIARYVNPVTQGWINYYGRFNRGLLRSIFIQLDQALVRWAMRSHKKLARKRRRARRWVGELAVREPSLFTHWRVLGWSGL